MRFILIFIGIFIGCGSSSLWAKTLIICSSCELRTIKDGIAAASDYDTLIIKKGNYTEYNIQLTKPLFLIGEDRPIIDGDGQGEIISVYADYVTVDGFHIVNVGRSYTTDYAAIRVVKSAHFSIRNNTFEKLFFGIFIEKSSQGDIINNQIVGNAENEYNSGNGIHLWYSEDIKISNNSIAKVRDGIYLEFASQITINNNKSYNNLRYGLHFMFSNDNVYQDNTFESNGAGVAVMFSKNISMLRNTFKKNWGTASFGLLLKEINDADISHNVFSENSIGINLEGSNRINFKNNDFSKNGWGIKVRGACYANTFSGNNFLYNSFDLSYNSNINDNVFHGNFWSNYTGYDLDKNGVGDVPYRPVKLFSYIVNRTPETIILLRSLFMDIIDFSEKVSPIFTPDDLMDASPQMQKIP
ncbi:nitrous oxide reductase family maturation protein NosD [Arenibacter sp. GZD96]|uniref:nitrous oxide reductase family maturation protein NosD n=1 Tax=Aurantibrevibacter litoralis TaxID=3106030 RepID=UPI002AFE77DA|nr:nitrous oxide reductase family maturation protein NosD [Arenibacter sp. GZD-96]MEA1785222.1 nitrous oxide reductase family maturation protein NosD [Arenibacter sp. GZD-96]